MLGTALAATILSSSSLLTKNGSPKRRTSPVHVRYTGSAADAHLHFRRLARFHPWALLASSALRRKHCVFAENHTARRRHRRLSRTRRTPRALRSTSPASAPRRGVLRLAAGRNAEEHWLRHMASHCRSARYSRRCGPARRRHHFAIRPADPGADRRADAESSPKGSRPDRRRMVPYH